MTKPESPSAPPEPEIDATPIARSGHHSVAPRTEPDTVVTSNAAAVAAGTMLGGRYRVLETLGHGGMGHVFVAENLIGGRVAVKVLRPELVADASFRSRFVKEAHAIAAIEHPNVVRFLDLVVGEPTFLVMEYVRGTTLTTVLKREERLRPERAIELTRRLSWGLEAAHQAGVVHRDIKPGNIMLATDLESGEQPKLIDFGVAKLAGASLEEQLTTAGQLVGTPHYMSPEQIESGAIDARADIYSLGCLLFHMLVGRPPFRALQEFQILRQHVEAAPERIDVAFGLPPAVAAVVARALQKKPADRFASAREMALALAGAQRSLTTVAVAVDIDTQRVRRAAPPPRGLARVGVPAAIAATAALSLVAGFALRTMTAGATTTVAAGLLLNTEPSGASVEVDGRVLDQRTPTAILGLKPGEHRVVLRHDGQNDVERRVDIKAGERRMVDIVLPPRRHRVIVNSAPPGASVYLDGTLVMSTTPTSMMVEENDFHELRIERPGYENLRVALKPEDRRPELTFELAPETQPRGSIMVDSNEAGEVWLDGVPTGYVTPTLAFLTSLGRHTVELHASGGAHSPPAHVEVHKGETVHLLLSLSGGAP